MASVSHSSYNRPPTDNHSLLTFLDDNVGEVHSVPSISDPTFHRGADMNAPFGDWFSRPLKIGTINWAEGSHVASGFNPWHSYFSNPEVYSKIKGFSRLRCKLHVKLLINASPFQYSLGVMSYRPLAGDNTIPAYSGGSLDDYYTVNNSAATLMSYTQMPHAHFEPQYSKGCEMELPFLYYMDWIPLEDSSLIHLRDMGRMSIASYAILRTAGTTTANPISISIYAWASDLELAGPSMSLQSKDEYSKKPISSTASAVASAAKSLERVPVIAPFARATGIMATSLGSLASLFGFSNPPVIDPVSSMRINYAANLSSTDIPTQIEKLSLDPKNELCVDSRTVGLGGEDQMSIKHILNRDVFFTSFQWNAADAPDQVLFSYYVNPAPTVVNSYTGAVTGVGVRGLQMVPSALMSQMFSSWRGPVKLKFVVAASQFHRGRLRISYDPSGPWSNSSTGDMRLYQKVWDLSSANTFEFEIPFMAPVAWLETYQEFTKADASSSTYWSDRGAAISAPYAPRFFNGALRIDVMSELTAPSATNVPVFVYINAKDVEFANPTSGLSLGQLSLAKLQSLDSVVVNDSIIAESIPVVDDIDNSTHVYMGEKVVSLRHLIHRSTYWDTIRSSLLGASNNQAYNAVVNSGLRVAAIKWVIPRLPMSFCLLPSTGQGPANGYPPWSVFMTTIGGTTTASYGCSARTTPLALITSCYAGWRGGMVWRAFIEGGSPNKYETTAAAYHMDDLYIERDQLPCTVIRPLDNTSSIAPANSKSHVLSSGGVISALASGVSQGIGMSDFAQWMNTYWKNTVHYRRSLFGGISKGTPNEVPVVDAVIPHYSPLRMMSSNPDFHFPSASGYSTPYTASYDVNDTFSVNMKISTTTPVFTDLNSITPVALFNHAGVDFTAFMFLAVPTIWFYTSTANTLPSLVNISNI